MSLDKTGVSSEELAYPVAILEDCIHSRPFQRFCDFYSGVQHQPWIHEYTFFFFWY